MRRSVSGSLRLCVLFLVVLSGCNYRPLKTEPTQTTNTNIPTVTVSAATPTPARLLTICMGQEPASLFLYGDASVAARSIRQAIYDGPFDSLNFDSSPVILEKKPSLAGGDAKLETASVQAGSPVVDSSGKLTRLEEGVSYLPAGCNGADCAATYAGTEPVQMEQLVVRFTLRGGLQWSDGAALTADDSVYSFEVARGLYPVARGDLIDYTQSYKVLDERSVEWRGIPGYRFAGYATAFFTPLPRHAWASLTPEALLTAEASSRTPLGWGPYVIDEWTVGDHISLERNPTYFRAAQGLPAFDRLVFRFMPSGDEALAALLAGECDYLDETVPLAAKNSELLDLQKEGRLKLLYWPGSAWEHLDFGILPYQAPENGGPLPIFQAKETRQAIATCIDRQRMASELFPDNPEVADSYVSAAHPLFNPDIRQYTYDPKIAGALFDAAGWLDADANPATPRLSQGLAGIPDGTPFEFTFLTTDEAEKQQAAKILQESLAACGVKINIAATPAATLFAAGPEGPIFGRNFVMAQFGWTSALEPPCFLYTTQEIPGPYPQFPKGWGGANASGYSNPEFDRLCQQALNSLPDMPEHKAAHFQAQALFAEELPALPLYLRSKMVAMRQDMCTVQTDSSSDTALWNLENFDYGEGCAK
jgi:peptide/nickel transport system substrate-binding protein